MMRRIWLTAGAVGRKSEHSKETYDGWQHWFHHQERIRFCIMGCFLRMQSIGRRYCPNIGMRSLRVNISSLFGRRRLRQFPDMYPGHSCFGECLVWVVLRPVRRFLRETKKRKCLVERSGAVGVSKLWSVDGITGGGDSSARNNANYQWIC